MIAVALAALCLAQARTIEAGSGPPGTVLVPGGRTTIGTETSEIERMIAGDEEAQGYAGALSSEMPRHAVPVGSFWLMATEVTNEQYAVYVRASGARSPESWRRERNDGSSEIPDGEGPLPVVFVDWNDARAYARWAGMRLMSELEYQRAVRGETAHAYPWGNEWEDGKRAATRIPDRGSGAFPVGSFPLGASRQGAFDLAGNVWEWTSSPYLPFPGYEPRVLQVGFGSARHPVNAIADWNGEQRVVVGGSFQNDRRMARASTRRAADRAQATDALGFRCAASPRPGQDVASAVLALELTPNVRARDSRGMVEFAPEATVCADGWAKAEPGTIARPADPAWSPPQGYEVIAGYRYCLFAPVPEIPAGDPGALEKLGSAEGLVALGFLSTNLAVLEPELAAGSYQILWRPKGFRSSKGRPLGPEEFLLEEVLRLDASLDNLVLIDARGRPARAMPCKLAWETMRESRASWIDPDGPQTGGGKAPEGSRVLRFELCVPCRSGQKGFAFELRLRLAPDELNVSWRPR